MIIDKITLFKSNLDSDYKNVIDSFYNNINKDNLIIKMKALFDYKEITLDKTKSFDGNKKEFLTLDLIYTQEDINNYNYITIHGRKTSDILSDKINLFYFIDSYEFLYSNNSNQLSTIKFNLIWDSWTNNIDSIQKFKNQNDYSCKISRRHKDLIYDYEADAGNLFIMYKNLLTDEENCITESTINESGKMILFARIYFTPDAKIESLYYDDNIGPETHDGMLTTLYPIKVMYVPLCVVDKYTRQIINSYKYYKIKFTEDESIIDKYDNFKLNYSILNYLSVFSHESYNQPYHKNGVANETIHINEKSVITDASIIANIDFTFQAPLVYEFFEGDSEGVYFNTSKSLISRVGEAVKGFLIGFACPVKYSGYGTSREYVKYTAIIPGNSRIWENTDIDSKSLIEPRINQYPYSYSSLYTNTFEVPLIPDYDTNYFNVEFYGFNVTTPYIRIYRDDQPRQIKKYYLSNNGSLQLVGDSLTQYLRENSAKITEQKAMGVLSSSIGTLTGNPLLIASNAINNINIMAKKIDADNRADSVMIPSFLSINDTEIQDSVIHLKYSIKDKNEKERICNYFTYYGININRIENPIVNERLNFDYVQTENINLSQVIKNNYDRKNIERAFNNGITKWHIDTCYSEAFKTFNKNYVNMQYNLGKILNYITE